MEKRTFKDFEKLSSEDINKSLFIFYGYINTIRASIISEVGSFSYDDFRRATSVTEAQLNKMQKVADLPLSTVIKMLEPFGYELSVRKIERPKTVPSCISELRNNIKVTMSVDINKPELK